MYLNCSFCVAISKIPETLIMLGTLSCYECLSLTTIPKTLMRLTVLFCYDCPMLTSIPSHAINTIISQNCKWLHPSYTKLDKLIMVQRKCKNFIRKRREVIMTSLKERLPKEVVIYVVLPY